MTQDASARSNSRARRWRSGVLSAAAIICLSSVWFAWRKWRPQSSPPKPPTLAIDTGDSSLVSQPKMASIAGGQFVQGRDNGPADSRPARRVKLDAFRMDLHEVTNLRFEQFVEETRYVTTAERLGYGWVFDFSLREVRRVDGADWRHPAGPDSLIIGREESPVVQVSWVDASMFASWDGKRLPTEAEFELAARGGLFDDEFPWGSEKSSAKAWRHNVWQGSFPHRPSAEDGFRVLARVGSFEPNAFGLYDMTGNVREWCRDRYRADTYQVGSADNPIGPVSGDERVVRGGSWMSPEQSGSATVWRRFHRQENWSDDQTGFRCAQSEKSNERNQF
jgi:formylglycine-generating enzyme